MTKCRKRGKSWKGQIDYITAQAKMRGLSQYEIAKEMGASQTSISFWANRVSIPRKSNREKIGLAYDRARRNAICNLVVMNARKTIKRGAPKKVTVKKTGNEKVEIVIRVINE